MPFVESLDAVLDRADVDAVTITSPFERRADLVERVASAGKHIFIDKPITNTLAEADKIVASVERHGVKLMAGHNYRFAPSILEARRRSGRPGGACLGRSTATGSSERAARQRPSGSS